MRGVLVVEGEAEATGEGATERPGNASSERPEESVERRDVPAAALPLLALAAGVALLLRRR